MTDSTRNEEDIRHDINTITDELKEILEYANQQLNIIKKDTELEEDYLQYDFDIVMIHTRPMLCEQIEIYKRILVYCVKILMMHLLNINVIRITTEKLFVISKF